MKKILLVLLFLPGILKAQFVALDSATFAFSPGDSLYLRVPTSFGDTVSAIIDTTGSRLWQIGSTLKPVFSNDTTATRGIMTDTLYHYPSKADDYFVLKLHSFINYRVNFWHRYQTDSMHAGGIVEFSSDSGTTWINVADCPAMAMQNIYTLADTLLTGQPAFSGTSNGEQFSSLQFINCVGERTTSTRCFPDLFNFSDVYIRFRFVSDSTVDSLSGWIIDSIKIVGYDCEGSVSKVENDLQPLSMFPNPATSMLTVQSGEAINSITIINLLGQTVYSRQFTFHSKQANIDVSELTTGVYFVKVNNEMRKFLKE